jgi:membrane-associated phospholipid phosphatase
MGKIKIRSDQEEGHPKKLTAILTFLAYPLLVISTVLDYGHWSLSTITWFLTVMCIWTAYILYRNQFRPKKAILV